MKEAIYKMLDILTGNKGLKKTINGFTVKLPTRYVNYFPADYETGNFNFLREHVKPGDQVLDIGAHIGLFATAAAQLTGPTGKVYAFEPAAETSLLLKQTVQINQFENIVECYREAVGAATGKVTFYVSSVKADNSNSLVSYKEDRPLFPMEVDMYSIDDFIQKKNIDRIAFIKIDVEGAEYDALLGAANTLKSMRPHCIVAIHPQPIAAKGDTLEKIYDFIHDCKYKMYYEGEILTKDFFCNNQELIDLHLLPV